MLQNGSSRVGHDRAVTRSRRVTSSDRHIFPPRFPSRLSQCWGIINTIPDHCDNPPSAWRLYLRCFLVRTDFYNDSFNPNFRCLQPCGGVSITTNPICCIIRTASRRRFLRHPEFHNSLDCAIYSNPDDCFTEIFQSSTVAVSCWFSIPNSFIQRCVICTSWSDPHIAHAATCNCFKLPCIGQFHAD